MTEPGNLTKTEILSQPESWAAALDVLQGHRQAVLDVAPAERFDQILFTGCGSTYYLSLAAASLTQELTGRPARALPASELWLYPRSSYVDRAGSPADGRISNPTYKTLLVAVSRSGETSETLQACQAFLDDKRGSLITLSCYGKMPLAQMGDFNIVLPSGQEQSVAQTRAFSTLYLGTVALAALWAGREDLFDALTRLPDLGRRVIEQAVPLASEVGPDLSIDRFYWLGSGSRYGLACELSLKMKEMSLSHSEPFHFMEFRHGPKSMITPSSLVTGLCSSVNAAQERAVLKEMRELDGRVLDIAETDAQVHFDSDLDESIRNVLFLPVGQLIALERSLFKGLNPDLPTHLDAVVRL